MSSALTIPLFFLLFGVPTEGNNFPSLLSTNVTLAVILDREYIGEDYEMIKTLVQNYMVYAKREKIKHGGVNVLFYSWSRIKIRKEVSAILSVTSCSETWKIFEIARAEHVLHMAISESDCPRLPPDLAFTIPLIKRGEELPQIILDLRSARAYDWKSITVLYDDSLSRDMATRVLTAVTSDSSQIGSPASTVSLVRIAQARSSANYDVRNLRERLTTLKWRRSGSNYLAIVSMELVPLVMDIAKALELVNVESQWLYAVSNSEVRNETIDEFAKHLGEGDNVAFVYNVTSADQKCKQGIDCHIEEVLGAFALALEGAILEEVDLATQVSDEEWEAIRPTKADRRAALLASMKARLARDGLCDRCTVWRLKAGDTWGGEFLAGAESSESSRYDLIEVGAWKPREGPALSDSLFPHVEHGFRARHLSLAAVHVPPWQILEKGNSTVRFRGIVARIVEELARSLNFTYSVVPVGNVSTGAPNSDFEFNDIVTYRIPEPIINLVRHKKVFFAASAFTISEKTRTLVNFTLPISTQTYSILAARPKELSRALLFMSPFTTSTWLTLLTAILVMGPILYVINKFTPVHEYKGINMKGGLSSIYNCIWYIYGAVLQQGGMYLPYADSARIIVGSWWLVVLVLSTTYCGNLVAFLTFPNSDKPISNLDDVLSHSSLTWTIASGSFLEDEAKNSNEQKYRNLYENSIKSYVNRDTMVEEIEKGYHVHIDWKMRLQYVMKRQFLLKDSCGLALGKEEFCEERIGLIVGNDNPYTDKINKEIKRLHQVGLIEKWLKDYLPKRDKCYKSKSSSSANNHTVNLDDMQGSFFVLFLGFSIGFSIILVERLFFRYRENRRKSNSIQPFVT